MGVFLFSVFVDTETKLGVPQRKKNPRKRVDLEVPCYVTLQECIFPLAGRTRPRRASSRGVLYFEVTGPVKFPMTLYKLALAYTGVATSRHCVSSGFRVDTWPM